MPHRWVQGLPARAAPRTIGFLTYSRMKETQPRLATFHGAMRELGYVDKRDYVLEPRFAEGDEARLGALADEILKLQPAIVLASASGAIRALLARTATVPVVSVGTGDPVGAGFAASFARPGRNFTGVSNMNVDTTPKLMDYLLRLVPGTRRIGLLLDPGSSSDAGHKRSAVEGAKALGIEIVEAPLRGKEDIDAAFASLAAQGVRTAVVTSTGFTVSQAHGIAAAALKHRIAAGSQNDALADAGLLVTYGSDRAVNYRRAAAYVDKIFKGARAGDLPIEQPVELLLVVNRRSLEALRLALPAELAVAVQRYVE
ncbi:ABC transporter substrate-binding protein [Ramlibacter albus]|uniref:ABC transporter substrate-binding protein n=1 Tax=Ramlibacter albus TaxID=2079448 RepID=A0A923MDE3_9BURK|nr:ABC transporter substrate-binding protein [Ramlibacter albus]MBC5767264.1 ABC transporter substrate-binding protein [Ramlibacter albus]